MHIFSTILFGRGKVQAGNVSVRGTKQLCVKTGDPRKQTTKHGQMEGGRPWVLGQPIPKAPGSHHESHAQKTRRKSQLACGIGGLPGHSEQSGAGREGNLRTSTSRPPAKTAHTKKPPMLTPGSFTHSPQGAPFLKGTPKGNQTNMLTSQNKADPLQQCTFDWGEETMDERF